MDVTQHLQLKEEEEACTGLWKAVERCTLCVPLTRSLSSPHLSHPQHPPHPHPPSVGLLPQTTLFKHLFLLVIVISLDTLALLLFSIIFCEHYQLVCFFLPEGDEVSSTRKWKIPLWRARKTEKGEGCWRLHIRDRGPLPTQGPQCPSTRLTTEVSFGIREKEMSEATNSYLYFSKREECDLCPLL